MMSRYWGGGECDMPSSAIAEKDRGAPLPSVEDIARLLREQGDELRDLARATVAAEKQERAHPLPGLSPSPCPVRIEPDRA